MRFVFLVLMPWFFLCCSTPEEPPSATSAVEDVAIVEGAHVAKSVVGGVVVPVAKPSPTASAGLWIIALNDAAAGDSLRMQAADHLLQIDCETLALSYRSKGNILLIRALIEDKIKEKDESVLPLLLLLFKQVDSEERIDFEHYILAFGRRAEADLYPLLHANNRSVALRAMDTLAKMRSSPAADTIAHFLRHESPWMRMSAAHALGEIGAQGAVDHLVETLNDSAYAVVSAALVGLGRLKAVEAYEPIEGLLVAANKHVRKHAAMALGELGDRRALEKVRAIAASDEDAGVRFMATKAVEKLEKVR